MTKYTANNQASSARGGNCAVIDIGSNSVRLLTGKNKGVTPKKVITTRLAAGILPDGKLSAEKMQETLFAIKSFIEDAKDKGALEIYIFATAAMRKALNGVEFAQKIFDETGIFCDILSGGDEALAGVLGVLEDADGTVLDIGGASTEITVRRGGVTKYSESFDIGAVALFLNCGKDRKKLNEYIDAKLLNFKIKTDGIFAVGGTVTTLAALMLKGYDPQKVHGFEINFKELSALTDKLFSLGTKETEELSGVDIKRADIIAGGALLLQKILEKLSANSVTVSERDNMEGYLLLKERGR